MTQQELGDGSLLQVLSTSPGVKGRVSGRVRIKKLSGYWKLEPIRDGTRIIYQLHSEPNGTVPAWLANTFVIDAHFTTLKKLRHALMKR